MDSETQERSYDSPNPWWFDGAILLVGFMIAAGLNGAIVAGQLDESWLWINFTVLLVSALIVIALIVAKLRKKKISPFLQGGAHALPGLVPVRNCLDHLPKSTHAFAVLTCGLAMRRIKRMRSSPFVPDTLRRRLLGLPALFALGLAGCASAPVTPRPLRTVTRVPPFSGTPGQLPRGWNHYVLRRDLPQTQYELATLEGRLALRASGMGTCSGLSCQVYADPLQMRWTWRTAHVPEAMGVEGAQSDDSPARIVLGFDGDPAQLSAKDRALFEFVELVTGQRLPHATLMYVWDAQLPVGTVVRNRRTARIRYLVVESGGARAGRWLPYERDLLSDFRYAFGEEPGHLESVGVLTDGDDLQADMQTWYGDVVLNPS